MSDKDGNVKWHHFIKTIFAIIVIMISYGISRAEFTQFEKRFDDNMTRLFDEIKTLKN